MEYIRLTKKKPGFGKRGGISFGNDWEGSSFDLGSWFQISRGEVGSFWGGNHKEWVGRTTGTAVFTGTIRKKGSKKRVTKKGARQTLTGPKEGDLNVLMAY